MKITIAPSEDQETQKHTYYAVTVEFPHDDMFTLEQAAEMLYQALTAFGFDGKLVAKAMQDYEP